MTDGTRNKLIKWTEKFSKTENGKFLNDFDWKSIPFDWSKRCNVDNGIMGYYSFGHIGLMELENVPECIWPTLIHELYHRWQWVKHPLIYLVGKLYRPLIENPADELTEIADNWIKENQ